MLISRSGIRVNTGLCSVLAASALDLLVRLAPVLALDLVVLVLVQAASALAALAPVVSAVPDHQAASDSCNC